MQGYSCTQGSQFATDDHRSLGSNLLKKKKTDPPWDLRLPEIGTGARTSQYDSYLKSIFYQFYKNLAAAASNVQSNH